MNEVKPEPQDAGTAMMPEATRPGAARPVFVYGTLRRGGSNDINRLRPAPRFLGVAEVRGALFDLGDYPGLLLASPGQRDRGAVHGEVYLVAPGLEAVLDRIEGITGAAGDEYLRREVDVCPAGGSPCTALVYEISPLHLSGRQPIPEGDWMVHLARRS